MNNIKEGGKRRGPARPKSEMVPVHISEPFNFRHDIHIPQGEVDTRSVDSSTRSLSPPPPCPGSKDGSSAEYSIPSEVRNESLAQAIKEDLLPALHIEIADIVEKKVKKELEPLIAAINNLKQPCQRCSEQNYDQSSSSTLEANTPGRYINLTTGHLDNINVMDSNKLSGATAPGHSDNNTEGMSTEQLLSGRPCNNPMYPISGGDVSLYLPIHTKAGALVKYGSEIHLVAAETLTQSQTSTLERSNTLPVGHGTTLRSSTASRLSGKKYKGTGTYQEQADERECLANALQMNVIELVNDVIFRDSELPDCLLEDDCLTENESIRCRAYPDPKDQVRLLLSIIKGRDLDVLKRFLKRIRQHNESVANKIVAQFEQNKKSGMRVNACAFCKLAGRVDVKYIADILYKNQLVDDGLYNTMFQTNLPTGAQGEIWHKVIACLNSKCAENLAIVKKTLEEALVHKNHYHQLAKELQWMLNKQNEITCQCTIRYIRPFRGSIMSIVSSRSPPTSTSDVQETSHDNRSSVIESDEEEATTPVQIDPHQTVPKQVEAQSSFQNNDNHKQDTPKLVEVRTQFQTTAGQSVPKYKPTETYTPVQKDPHNNVAKAEKLPIPVQIDPVHVDGTEASSKPIQRSPKHSNVTLSQDNTGASSESSHLVKTSHKSTADSVLTPSYTYSGDLKPTKHKKPATRPRRVLALPHDLEASNV